MENVVASNERSRKERAGGVVLYTPSIEATVDSRRV